MKRLLFVIVLSLFTIPAFAHRHSDRLSGVRVFSYIPRENTNTEQHREYRREERRPHTEECSPHIEREYIHRHNNDYYYHSPAYYHPREYYYPYYNYPTYRPSCEHYYTPPVCCAEVYMENRVAGFFGGFGYHICYKLQNGSVWRQIEDRTYAYEAECPRAFVYRSDCGAYYMRIEGCDFRVRVERVE